MGKRIGIGGLAVVVALGLAVAVRAESLGQAESLLEAGRLEEARRLAVAIADGEGAAGERAAALELLGRIAVESRDFAAARRHWERLRREHPGSAPAADVAVKLALLEEILGPAAADAAPAAAPSTDSGSDPPANLSPAPAPAPVAAPAPAPEPRSDPAGQPAPPPAALEEAGRTVLVAGDGTPPEVIEQIVGEIRDHLRGAGVDAVLAPNEIWWRRTLEMAEPALLLEARRSGAAGVVWVDFRFGHREKVTVRCLDRQGRKLWQEVKTGGFGFTDHRPHEVVNRELLEKVEELVARHVGDPCLPVER